MDFISRIDDMFGVTLDGVKYTAKVRMLHRYNNENYICVRLYKGDPSDPQEQNNASYAIMREIVVGDDLKFGYIKDKAFADFILKRMIKQCQAIVRDQRDDFCPYNEPDYE